VVKFTAVLAKSQPNSSTGPLRQARRLYSGGTHLHICTRPLGNICTLELEPSELNLLSQFLGQVLSFPTSCIVVDDSSTTLIELAFEVVNRKKSSNSHPV
jgi:hypothetical protein